jgi:hypothetical protein
LVDPFWMRCTNKLDNHEIWVYEFSLHPPFLIQLSSLSLYLYLGMSKFTPPLLFLHFLLVAFPLVSCFLFLSSAGKPSGYTVANYCSLRTTPVIIMTANYYYYFYYYDYYYQDIITVIITTTITLLLLLLSTNYSARETCQRCRKNKRFSQLL